ncbi:MerR family transcriptional regulator [Pseudoalteromonas sp. MMG010]|uniref:MerR family transcriptional regulator n=1 Tax=Pseudoalteromonas sp. MMG010 TaxID=2822685 RepID=UPI001B39F312|nr:MerR family transcriptional regulator [Pseudoalteromonas sp. MMG010]MBQ4833149.1 MerR family transcriptional regulator [Pseudoalteromonas sp. MMG010]
MLIGRVSELSGATRKAIRHYESIGLIAPPNRKGNYRIYNNHDVVVIKMICQARALGFSLFEIKDIVSQKTKDKKLPIAQVNRLIDKKISDLKQEAHAALLKVENLAEFKKDLVKEFD